MTQGIFIHGSRPKSKRHIKAVVDRAQLSEAAQTSLLDSEAADRRIMGAEGKDDWMHTHVHDLHCIVIEATSIFGDEYDGSLAVPKVPGTLNPDGTGGQPRITAFTFVGPDPYTHCKFYGSIKWKPDSSSENGGKWIVI